MKEIYETLKILDSIIEEYEKDRFYCGVDWSNIKKISECIDNLEQYELRKINYNKERY